MRESFSGKLVKNLKIIKASDMMIMRLVGGLFEKTEHQFRHTFELNVGDPINCVNVTDCSGSERRSYCVGGERGRLV